MHRRDLDFVTTAGLDTAVGAFPPQGLAARAQYFTESAAQFAGLIADREARGAALNGAVLDISSQPLKVSFSAFKG